MDSKWEIAQLAAQHIVDEGMAWGAAKRHAAESLGLSRRVDLPDNDLVLQAVREHIALFGGADQAEIQRQLMQVALVWMDRMAAYRPHITGAIWLGIGTQWSDIHLDLYCDDPKMPEIDLLNQGVAFDVGQATNAKGQDISQLVVLEKPEGWHHGVAVVMSLHDADDIRGALKSQKDGQAPRGDATALRQLIKKENHE